MSKKRLDPLLVFLVLVFIFEVAITLHLSLEVGRLSPGVLLHFDGMNQGWIVLKQTPYFWPGLNQAGSSLVYGDIFWKASSPCFTPEIPRALNDILTGNIPRGTQSISITVLRDGACLELPQVPVSPITLRMVVDIWLPNFIIWLGFWSLGVIIYQASSKKPLNRTAVLAMGLAAALFSQERPGIFETGDLFQRSVECLSILIRGFLPVVFLDFSLLFPTPILQKQQRVIHRIFLATNIIVTLVYLLQFGFSWSSGKFDVGLGYTLNSLLNFLSFVFLILRIFSALFIDSVPGQRRRLSVVLIGLMLSIPFLVNYSYAVSIQNLIPPIFIVAALLIFLVFFNSIWLKKASLMKRLSFALLADAVIIILLLIIRLLEGPILFYRGIELKYLMMGIPLAMTYIIIRYKSFQSKNIVLSAVLILIISAVLANLLALLLYRQNPGAFQSPPFGELLLFSFPFGVFCSSLNSVQGLLGRLVKRSELNFQVVESYSLQISGTIKRDVILNQIVNTLFNKVKISLVSFWEFRPDLGFVLIRKTPDFPDSCPQLLSRGDLPDRPVQLNDEESEKFSFFDPLRTIPGLELVAPLVVPDTQQLLGLLTFGTRDGEEHFDPADLEFLKMIIQLSTMQLRAADIYENNRKEHENFLRSREETRKFADEQIRKQVSRDLHDKIIPSLGGTRNSLEIVKEDLPTDYPGPSRKFIALCLDETISTINTVRKIISNIQQKADTILIDHLLALSISDFQTKNEILMSSELDIPDPEEFSQADSENLHALLNNALNNIASHSRANKVQIRFLQKEGWIHFHISDNGIGFNVHERERQAYQDGHYGLYSMRTRIQDMNGEMEIISEPGMGTLIQGGFPLQIRK